MPLHSSSSYPVLQPRCISATDRVTQPFISTNTAVRGAAELLPGLDELLFQFLVRVSFGQWVFLDMNIKKKKRWLF